MKVGGEVADAVYEVPNWSNRVVAWSGKAFRIDEGFWVLCLRLWSDTLFYKSVAKLFTQPMLIL